MKRFGIWALLLALGLCAPAVGARAATYDIDPVHSSVSFKVRHLMVSKVTGKFDTFSGTLEFVEGEPDAWSVSATIDVASVSTNDEKRDKHLRSADFFDVETYPEMIFVSTGVDRDGEDYVLRGDLTLHGVTRPVALALEFNGEVTDPWGNQRVGFSADGELDRSEFGITWNNTLDTGGVVVGDDVSIELEIEAVAR